MTGEKKNASRRIIHSDDKELVRLRSRIDELRAELAEAETRLGCSNADFAAYRAKKGSLESEFTVLKAAMVRVSERQPPGTRFIMRL